VAFRGKVPNPKHALLPGLYVTVQLTAGTLNKGFKVPQLAVLRDGQGPYVLVASAEGPVVQKRVDTISVVDNHWIISSGLAEGDKVIVDHLQMVQPGMPVTPTEAGAQGQAAGPGPGMGNGAAPAAQPGPEAGAEQAPEKGDAK
jgi:membrane fusion protein (multidrug efflux system)